MILNNAHVGHCFDKTAAAYYKVRLLDEGEEVTVTLFNDYNG